MARVALVLSTAQTWTKVIEMKYIVEIPWHGVKKGQMVEFEKLHPALKANVKPIDEEMLGELTPATPEATADKKAPAKK